MEGTFDVDKENSLDKGSQLGTDKVGYKSVHYVCQLSNNRVELIENTIFKDLKFEIQVRTILQHSWAEIEHDKNYKFAGELPTEIQRRFKLIAGSLEILDREFNQIAREIDLYSKNVKENTEQGKLEDIFINTTSLKEYLLIKFNIVIKAKIIRDDFNNLENEMLEELRDFGIKTIHDLDQIIPSNLIDLILKINMNTNYAGILRSVMLINDYEKYLNNSFKNHWSSLSLETEILLKQFEIDIDELNRLIEEKNSENRENMNFDEIDLP